MQFKVEPAGVAHRLPAGVASPQCCGACVTVGAQCARSLADDLQPGKGNRLETVVTAKAISQTADCAV